jgi:competence protein ComEC
MYIYPIFNKKFNAISSVGGLKETFLMSLSAQLAVAPILAYTFHSFSLVALPVNLIVLPLMPYSMLFGFITGVIGWLSVPLGQIVGWITWALVQFQLHVIRWFANLSFSSITISIHWATMTVLYGIIIWWVWKKRIRFPRKEDV